MVEASPRFSHPQDFMIVLMGSLLAYQDDVERKEPDEYGGGMGYITHTIRLCVIRVMVGEGG